MARYARKRSFASQLKEWAILIILILCGLGAVVFGLYMGLYVCLYGGIVDVITGITSTPVNPGQAAFGIVKFFCTGIVGWASFFVGAFITGGLAAIFDK